MWENYEYQPVTTSAEKLIAYFWGTVMMNNTEDSTAGRLEAPFRSSSGERLHNLHWDVILWKEGFQSYCIKNTIWTLTGLDKGHLQQSEWSYRQRVQHNPEEQDHKQKKNPSDENPSESPPDYELHGLAGVYEPEEWRIGATDEDETNSDIHIM